MGKSFKLKSGNTTPFKEMGSSPKVPNVKGFNVTGSNWPDKTPGYESTKAAKQKKLKQSFDKFQASKQKAKDFAKNLKIKQNKGISGVTPKKTPSNVRVAGPGTRKLSIEAAKKVANVGKFLRGSSLVGAAYGLFKGYGKLSKTEHGKEIIKQSGVGRTRKI
jgi:hypothetical protein